MKYHYFHGRFTYSVKRRRAALGGDGGFGLRLAPRPALILVLKGERSARWRGGRGGGRLTVAVASVAAPPVGFRSRLLSPVESIP